jgi:uncharacterized protein DUF11
MKGLRGCIRFTLKPQLVGAFLLLVGLTLAASAASANAQVGHGGADLSLTKTDAPDPISSTGAHPLTYTITVRNQGPQTATRVRVTDPQVVEAVFLDASASCYFGHPEVIFCDLGTLAPGAQATVMIRYAAVNPGVLTNCASVSAATPDPNVTNNAACTTTTVVP